ncbi:hypothetical protein L2E82_42841 [Cichorium intybus]|uniref:Uncharacterized protein n=1 Tax=Cichorium intybus TaxID=13427 RepID=A0ACB8ZS27_CICIN|nr:hypothetical protein L2E82_42841 [Cichorium intybus]
MLKMFNQALSTKSEVVSETADGAWWSRIGDLMPVGETIQIGNFDPKIATFWLDSGKLKGVLLESGSPEEFKLLPTLARSQPSIDKVKLQSAASVEEALEIARAAL